jgi:exosortase/archaeosortase family protein
MRQSATVLLAGGCFAFLVQLFCLPRLPEVVLIRCVSAGAAALLFLYLGRGRGRPSGWWLAAALIPGPPGWVALALYGARRLAARAWVAPALALALVFPWEVALGESLDPWLVEHASQLTAAISRLWIDVLLAPGRPPALVGANFTLLIVPACAGMHVGLNLLALGALVAALYCPTPRRAIAAVGITLVLGTCGNLLRLVATTLLAPAFAARPEWESIHTAVGVFVYGATYAVMAMVGRHA